MNKRWDVRIGVAASAIAVLGLTSSVLSDNETLLFPEILGSATLSQQKTLLVFALFVAAMTAVKWWQARRNGDL